MLSCKLSPATSKQQKIFHTQHEHNMHMYYSKYNYKSYTLSTQYSPQLPQQCPFHLYWLLVEALSREG